MQPGCLEDGSVQIAGEKFYELFSNIIQINPNLKISQASDDTNFAQFSGDADTYSGTLDSFEFDKIYRFENIETPFILTFLSNITIAINDWIDTFPLGENNSYNPQQEWLGKNEYGNTYYYPVLPKFDQTGNMVGTIGENKVPFGSTGRNWNEDDKVAYITKNNILDNELIMDANFEEFELEAYSDISGQANKYILINDYRVNFDKTTTKPQRKTGYIKNISSSDREDNAF
jgi:hypothetical protein